MVIPTYCYLFNIIPVSYTHLVSSLSPHLLFQSDQAILPELFLSDNLRASETSESVSYTHLAEYIEHFKPWVDEGYEVIHINLGSSLSSAHQNCCIAAEELGHVHVIDSCSLSTGTGLLVTDAGRMIEQGLKAEDIAEALRERTKHCHASFILDTLTFLHAGGRCSTVAALGANVLKLKPCIEVSTEDGSMNVGKKYRGTLDKVLVKYVKDKLCLLYTSRCV